MNKTILFYVLSLIIIVAIFFALKIFQNERKDIEASNNSPNSLDGYSKRKSEDYLGAITDFDKAILKEPNNHILYNERGLCKEKLGDYNDAIEDFQKAIKLKDNYADAYYNLGHCKFKNGDKEGACSNWQKSLDLKGHGKFELETNCNLGKKVENTKSDNAKSKEKKTPPSAHDKKLRGFPHRLLDLIKNNNTSNFSYVYLNDKPYGRRAQVIYDDFYETYSISFFNSSGESISFQLKNSNFTGIWEFIYSGGKYELTNYKNGKLY
jgi:tetratricopeptide (TPR) repeat protein